MRGAKGGRETKPLAASSKYRAIGAESQKGGEREEWWVEGRVLRVKSSWLIPVAA